SGHRIEIGDHGGLDEITVAWGAFATRKQTSFPPADLDVVEDGLHGALVDHRAHAHVVFGQPDGDSFRVGLELFEELAVDILVHHDARTGRALLAREAEGGGGHSFHGGIEIGIGIHHDGVLAAHFEHRALDPDLSLLGRGGARVYVQADIA